MLETALISKTLDPPKSGALGLSLFSLVVNPRLVRHIHFVLFRCLRLRPVITVHDVLIILRGCDKAAGW